MEGKLTGTLKAEAAQRRLKEYQDNAAERGLKRAKSNLEETQMDMTTTSTSSSSSGDAAPASLSSSGAHTLKPVSLEEDDVCNEAGNKRKTDGGHPEEPLNARPDNGLGLKEGRQSIT